MPLPSGPTEKVHFLANRYNKYTMKVTATKIELHDMHFYAYHGVMEQERHVGNNFVLQLTAWVDVPHSLVTDKLEHTVSYAEIYDVIAEEMAIPSKLLEHVVGRIGQHLFKAFPRLDRISLSLSKVKPPFPGEVSEAAFTLEASRD